MVFIFSGSFGHLPRDGCPLAVPTDWSLQPAQLGLLVHGSLIQQQEMLIGDGWPGGEGDEDLLKTHLLSLPTRLRTIPAHGTAGI